MLTFHFSGIRSFQILSYWLLLIYFLGKSISHLKTQIKSGFFLKGTINILGYTVKCEILVHFPKSIKVSAEMAPVKIGNGLIKLTRKAKDLENGPKLYVGLSTSEVCIYFFNPLIPGVPFLNPLKT